ncbi:TPA: hypothetical protein ACN60A_005914, partial [Klebsiella michiganensis]
RLQSHAQGTIIGVSIYKSSSYLPVAPNNWNEKKAALLRRFFFVFITSTPFSRKLTDQVLIS